MDGILDSWLNDVMFQDGFQDILGQPLVDGTLLVVTVSYVEVYQVVLDIMLGQSLKSILNDVFNNFPIILLPTIVMVQLSRVLLKIPMGSIMVMNAILLAEICNTKYTLQFSILHTSYFKQYLQNVYLSSLQSPSKFVFVSDERGACHYCNHDRDCDQERCPHVATNVLDLDGVLSGWFGVY